MANFGEVHRAPTQEQLDAKLERDYSYFPVNEDQRERMEGLREHMLEVARHISSACQASPERTLALRYLQQAKMWAVQCVVNEEDGS